MSDIKWLKTLYWYKAPIMTDFEELQRYAKVGSGDAFAILVGKYTDLVYSAALRQMGNKQDAEDVSQVVFMILSRKAATVRSDTILSGWLVRTTRLVALNARRKRAHRWQAETAVMSLHQTETDEAWSQIAPILDEALVSLCEKDRGAAMLRFFEQKSFKEIAQAMGISDDAAQKRVSRAIEKLRSFFVKRGVIVPSVLVMGAITSRAVHSAPVELACSISTKAVLGAGAASSLSGLVNNSLAALEVSSARKLLVKIAAATLALFLILIAGYQLRPKAPGLRTDQKLGVAPIAPPIPQPAVAPMAPQPAQPGQRNLLLRIVDSQRGTPVARAQVTSAWSTGYPTLISNNLATDVNGECLIAFGPNAEDLWNLRLEIQRDGYVRKFVSWAAVRGDLLEDMPAEFTTELETGQILGGLVLSATGEPISGVTVAIVDNYPSSAPGGLTQREARREGIALAHTETTDAEGRWMCNHIPHRLEGFTFYLTHPNYVAAAFTPREIENAASTELNRLSTGDFRNQTAVMVLNPGIALSGVILDEDRKPIGGAMVTQNRAWTDPAANQVTTPDGRFRFGNTSRTDLILTAQAVGFVVDDVTVASNCLERGVCFTLKRAAVLRGRVLDSQGFPISKASVVARGGDFGQNRFEWSRFTDAQGRFEWLSAPPSQNHYSISATGYRNRNKLELPPDGSEHLVTLEKVTRSRPGRVFGTVVDVETGMPVEDFQVWASTVLRRKNSSAYPTFMTLARELKTTGQHGKFSFLAVNDSVDALERLDLEVKADGYLLGSGMVNGPVTNDCGVALRLRTIAAIKGMVQLPDGQPAAGAVIVLCAKREGSSRTTEVDGVYMSRPYQVDSQFSHARHAETDVEGRFTLYPDTTGGTLLAVHKLGFVEQQLDPRNGFQTIRLQPYGRISGMLRVVNEPGNGRTVFLSTRFGEESPPLNLHLGTVADIDGRFLFEGVPPGEWILSPHAVRVQVKPAETTLVVLGGAGRKVRGRLALKEPSQALRWQDYRVSLVTQVPGWAAPSRDQFGSPLEFSEAQRQWLLRKSEFRRANALPRGAQDTRQYDVVLMPDGTFSLEEVLPGTYDLQFVLDPLLYDARTMNWLSGISRVVMVPEVDSTGASSLDLGILELPNP